MEINDIVQTIKIKIMLKSVPTCEKSNMVVFDSSLQECRLDSSSKQNNLVACIFTCLDKDSKQFTIGFERPFDRPAKWMLCDVNVIKGIV